MANQVGCALSDAGELGVELVPAGVVVADQVTGVTLHDAQGGDRGLGSGADRRVPDQPRIRGAHGDRVRGPSHRLTMLIGVLVDHVGGGLIGAEHVFGAQRGCHGVIEPGRGQALGEALQGTGDEPRRHRGAQQRGHQHRGPLHGHIALTGQQDRRGIDVRPVSHVPGCPTRWHRGGRAPATATPPRQQVVHLLQHDRQDVPDLRPAHPRIRGIGQVSTTPRTRTRRGQRLGPIRRHHRCQPRALTARLPTTFTIRRALPRRTIRPPLGLGPDRILRRRHG